MSCYLFSVENSVPQKFCGLIGRSSLSPCSFRKPILRVRCGLFLRKYRIKIYKFIQIAFGSIKSNTLKKNLHCLVYKIIAYKLFGKERIFALLSAFSRNVNYEMIR